MTKKSAESLFPRNDMEASLMIFQQYGCLNKTRTMTIPIDANKEERKLMGPHP